MAAPGRTPVNILSPNAGGGQQETPTPVEFTRTHPNRVEAMLSPEDGGVCVRQTKPMGDTLCTIQTRLLTDLMDRVSRDHPHGDGFARPRCGPCHPSIARCATRGPLMSTRPRRYSGRRSTARRLAPEWQRQVENDVRKNRVAAGISARTDRGPLTLFQNSTWSFVPEKK